MAWIAAAAAVGGSLLSGSQEKNASSARNAAEIDLASTAHQRETQDLIKAGLNPMLSAGGRGAASPDLSVPRIPDYGQAASNAVMAAKNAKEKELLASQIKKTDSEKNFIDVQASNYPAVVQAQTRSAGVSALHSISNVPLTSADIHNAVLNAFKIQAETRNSAADTRRINLQSKILKGDIPGADLKGRLDSTSANTFLQMVQRALRPISELLGVGSSALGAYAGASTAARSNAKVPPPEKKPESRYHFEH